MKYLFAFMMLGFLACGPSAEEAIRSSTYAEDISAVKSMMQRQSSDWNRGDIEAFMVGYLESDELKFVGSSGMREGYQATLEAYQKGYPTKADMGNLSFAFIHDEQLGSDHMLLHGRYTLTFADDRPSAEGPFTLILHRIDGAWKIIYDHSC